MPAVRVLMAGVVVITPPAASSVISISEPTITGVAATVIVPAAVHVNVPRRVVGEVRLREAPDTLPLAVKFVRSNDPPFPTVPPVPS